ncbi:MAG: hypothetical protein ACI83I_001597 [Bacteroidia bacterium]|jgi:hypothetical protein
MKRIYLILSIIGFIAPNIYVAMESYQTGNFLLWLDPQSTLAGMFGNQISTAFIVDLFVVVLVFFIWTHFESKRLKMKTPWLIWVLTLLFGMAGTFPLFLFQRAQAIETEAR